MFATAVILFLLGLLAFSRAQVLDMQYDMQDPPLGNRWRIMGVVLIFAAVWILLFTVAQAQDGPTRIETAPASSDPAASIPLRDYLSSRVDQLQQLMDERDRQYAQRFAAQQEAVQAALQAAKEAVANALSAAKEAVTKAEDASNKRFEGVNEFRQSLDDLSRLQMPRAEAEARFDGIEEKVSGVVSRLDNRQSSGEGASTLWGYIAGAAGLGIAAIVLFRKQSTERDKGA